MVNGDMYGEERSEFKKMISYTQTVDSNVPEH